MFDVQSVPSSRPSRPRPVRFAERFQGPPGMANGGFLAGTLAAAIGGPAEITLKRPTPLERALRLARSVSGAELWDGELLIASAARGEPDLDLPAPLSFVEACVATMRIGDQAQHPFPHCFVCGPARSGADAMRLLAGPTYREGVVAAAWMPDPALCRDVAGHGVSEVPVPLIWAALDCPGAWGIMSAPHIGPRPMVLGKITGRVVRAPRAGARHVVMGWRLGEERRKHFCGTAIFDEHGEVCAYARSTWIAL